MPDEIFQKLKKSAELFSRKNPRKVDLVSLSLQLAAAGPALLTFPNAPPFIFKIFYQGSGGLKSMFLEANSAAQKSTEKHNYLQLKTVFLNI